MTDRQPQLAREVRGLVRDGAVDPAVEDEFAAQLARDLAAFRDDHDEPPGSTR